MSAARACVKLARTIIDAEALDRYRTLQQELELRYATLAADTVRAMRAVDGGDESRDELLLWNIRRVSVSERMAAQNALEELLLRRESLDDAAASLRRQRQEHQQKEAATAADTNDDESGDQETAKVDSASHRVSPNDIENLLEALQDERDALEPQIAAKRSELQALLS